MEIAKDVMEAIQEVGIQMSYLRTIRGTGPDAAGDTTETHTITAVVSPASGGTIQAFDIRFQNGTLITTHLRALKVAAYGLAFTPLPGDKVSGLEGSTWVVLGCTPQSYQGVPLTYDMTVQR